VHAVTGKFDILGIFRSQFALVKTQLSQKHPPNCEIAFLGNQTQDGVKAHHL